MIKWDQEGNKDVTWVNIEGREDLKDQFPQRTVISKAEGIKDNFSLTVNSIIEIEETKKDIRKVVHKLDRGEDKNHYRLELQEGDTLHRVQEDIDSKGQDIKIEEIREEIIKKVQGEDSKNVIEQVKELMIKEEKRGKMRDIIREEGMTQKCKDKDTEKITRLTK